MVSPQVDSTQVLESLTIQFFIRHLSTALQQMFFTRLFLWVIPLFSFPLFIALFAYSIYFIYNLRKDEAIEMMKLASSVSDEFGISQEKANIYGYFQYSMEVRRKLSRKQKKKFDRERVAFSRLASIKASHQKPLQNDIDHLVSTINSL